MMPLECKVPGCGKRTEGKTGLCASHNRAIRKIITTPIKKVGDKLKKDLTAYAESRRVFLQKNPHCAVYPHLKATTIHHKKGRLGKLLLDQKYWLAVSMQGHVYIELHPVEAKLKGWSVSRLAKEND